MRALQRSRCFAYRAGMMHSTDLQQPILQSGYALVPAQCGLLAVDPQSTEWRAFAATWSDLVVDHHMADHGRYRRRRHAVFTIRTGTNPQREPDQAHFQTLQYNPLSAEPDPSRFAGHGHPRFRGNLESIRVLACRDAPISH
jgi:hypothetical protein